MTHHIARTDADSAPSNGRAPVSLWGLTLGIIALAVTLRGHAVWGQLPEGSDSSGQVLGPLLSDDSPVLDSLGGPLDGPESNCEPTGPFRHPGPWTGRSLPGLFGPHTGAEPGTGQPPLCESWRYRPFSAGWMMGMMQGSPLIDDWVGGNQGFFAGYRLGWDYDPYWGCEMRFAFGNAALYDSERAKDAQQAADDDKNLAQDDPFRRRFDRRRDCTAGLWDVSLLYYPWGDAAWRPYLMAGLGTARIKFIDRLSTRYDETVFAMPVAVGVKYRLNDWLAVRLECADNIAFGDSFNTVHLLSLTGGMEVRFGGSRVAYWPWHPGRHYW